MTNRRLLDLIPQEKTNFLLLLEMFRYHLVFDAKVVYFLLTLFILGIRKLHTPSPLIEYMKQLALESKTKTTASNKSVKETHNK